MDKFIFFKNKNAKIIFWIVESLLLLMAVYFLLMFFTQTGETSNQPNGETSGPADSSMTDRPEPRDLPDSAYNELELLNKYGQDAILFINGRSGLYGTRYIGLDTEGGMLMYFCQNYENSSATCAQMSPELTPQDLMFIDEMYSADKNNVYFYEKKLEGLDPATFSLVETGEWIKDKNAVYCLKNNLKYGPINEEADILNEYFIKVPQLDPKTVGRTNHEYVKDDYGVYLDECKETLTPHPFDFDAPTLRTLDNRDGGKGGFQYFIDKNGVYYKNNIQQIEKIQNADPLTFTLIDSHSYDGVTARDKNGLYHNETFKYKPNQFGTTVYWDAGYYCQNQNTGQKKEIIGCVFLYRHPAEVTPTTPTNFESVDFLKCCTGEICASICTEGILDLKTCDSTIYEYNSQCDGSSMLKIQDKIIRPLLSSDDCKSGKPSLTDITVNGTPQNLIDSPIEISCYTLIDGGKAADVVIKPIGLTPDSQILYFELHINSNSQINENNINLAYDMKSGDIKIKEPANVVEPIDN